MTLLKLIAKDSFITFNKVLAKKIGVNGAIVFGELCSIANMFNYEEFFYQKEKIEEDTCLGTVAVRSAIKTLIDTGLVTVTKKGIPCKYYYKINEDVLISLLDDEGQVTTSSIESDTTSDIETDTTSTTEASTTSSIETDTTFKRNKQKNISKENNKDTPYKDVISHYFDNFKKLYELGKVNTEKPIISYPAVSKRLFDTFKSVDKESVIKALDNAMNDDWVVKNGYPIMAILSANQLNKFINSKSIQTNETPRSVQQSSGIIGCMQSQEEKDIVSRLMGYK